jgi:hypothetical protein
MKWICNDKIVSKPKSIDEIKKYLDIGYIRVENGKWDFIQVCIEEDHLIYVEVCSEKNNIESFELNSIDELFDLLVKFDPEIIKCNDNAFQLNHNWRDGICEIIFRLCIILGVFQVVCFLIFYYFTNINPNPWINLFGTFIWVFDAFCIRAERFHADFYDCSRASSPISFWNKAISGLVAGAVIIAFSYIV